MKTSNTDVSHSRQVSTRIPKSISFPHTSSPFHEHLFSQLCFSENTNIEVSRLQSFLGDAFSRALSLTRSTVCTLQRSFLQSFCGHITYDFWFTGNRQCRSDDVSDVRLRLQSRATSSAGVSTVLTDSSVLNWLCRTSTEIARSFSQS